MITDKLIVSTLSRHFLEISPEEKNLVSLKRQLNFIKTLPALPQEKLHKTIALAPKRMKNGGKERIAENVGKLLEGE